MVTGPEAPRRANYHHGDLAATLIAATVDLVAEKGPSGFSLREVARRAGVSPAAPSHHFGDARGLLTAVAVQGFEYLDRSVGEAVQSVTVPADRLRALAFASVDIGLRHPGHVAVMFRPDLVDGSNEAFQEWSGKPLQRLGAVVAALAPHLDPEQVDAVTSTIWATLNGFVNLYTSTADRLDADPDLRRLVATAVDVLHTGTIATDGAQR